MSGMGRPPRGGGEALFPMITAGLCIDPLTIADIETFVAHLRRR